MGRVQQGRDVEFQKWELRFVEGRDTWWKFRMSLGHGDAWIRVLVRCYTECNTQRFSQQYHRFVNLERDSSKGLRVFDVDEWSRDGILWTAWSDIQ